MIRKTNEPLAPAFVTVSLSIDAIAPSPNNARKRVGNKDAELAGMVESIASVGIIEPVIVRQRDGAGGNGQSRYELVAGERRWRAARKAGLSEVPPIIRDDLDDGKAALLGLVENLQREDLNPVEECTALRSLIDDHGLSRKDLQQVTGRAESWVNNTLRFLELPKRFQQWLESGEITRHHGISVLAFLGDEPTVRELERNVESDLRAGTLRSNRDLQQLGMWLKRNRPAECAEHADKRRSKTGVPRAPSGPESEHPGGAADNKSGQNDQINAADEASAGDSPGAEQPQHVPVQGPEALARFRAAWLRHIVATEVLDQFPVIASRLWLLLTVQLSDGLQATARQELLRGAIAAAGLGAFKTLGMASIAAADRAALAKLRASLLRAMILYDRDGLILVSDQLVEAAAGQARVDLEKVWKRDSEDGSRQHFAGPELTESFFRALRDDQLRDVAQRWAGCKFDGATRERIMERLASVRAGDTFGFPARLIAEIAASDCVLGKEGRAP